MAAPARWERRRGLQTEVLVGLTVVMVAATGVLAAVGIRVLETHVTQLRELAARALLDDARLPMSVVPGPPGSSWWRVSADDTVVSRGHAEEIDAISLELAAASREAGKPLLRAGSFWSPLHFAAPTGDGGASVARLPSAAPPELVLGLLLGTVAVFTAFGFSVLRGRVVGPLERLAAAVDQMKDGSLDARASEEGVIETAEVARAFNEMAEALSNRTEALEKAVADLRHSNASLRAARDGLDRAERLAAVGSLASGVAHEVGNPMGALLAYLDLASRDASLSEVGRSHLAKAARQGERVRLILRELLDFSRPARAERVAVDLAAIARETIDLAGAQRRYAGIDFAVDVEGSPPAALADRGAVSQVLLNLILNAADAVKIQGGRVRVLVRPTAFRIRAGEEASEAEARRRFDAVELRVEDDGPGVAEGDRERIFDPFFTTKDPGQGTGLGLSNALRIAEQMNGRLDLDASLTQGAAFSLFLPAFAESIDPSVREEQASTGTSRDRGGRGG